MAEMSPDKQVMNLQQISDRESHQSGATRLSDPSHIKIWYNAEPRVPTKCANLAMCVFCIEKDMERSYLYLREGAIESNDVNKCACAALDSCFPQTQDWATVRYFDRGNFMKKKACCGCCSFYPSIEKKSRDFMCLCMQCKNDPENCWCTSYWYGPDYVTYVPFETFCCCIPNKVNFCCNYCGLYGPISGGPLIHTPYFIGQQPKDADAFVAQAKQVVPVAQKMR